MSTTDDGKREYVILHRAVTPSPSPDHPRIWLEPEDEATSDTGRLWCQDNVWGDKATEYVRADVAASGRWPDKTVAQIWDERDRLRAELETAQDREFHAMQSAEMLRADLAAASSALASMREALTPFANSPYAALSEASAQDTMSICDGITIGDLRKARAALKEGTPSQDTTK